MKSKLVGFSIIFVFIFLAITGLFSINSYNILPSKFILFLLLLFSISSIFLLKFFSLFLKKRTTILIKKPILFIFLICSIYIFFNFVHSVIYANIHILDFILSYLSFFYLIAFASMYNKIYISYKFFKYFYIFLLFLFLFKYAISRIINPIYRPGIFIENNYELLFLQIISFAYVYIYKKYPILLLSVLILIHILAGSRSAIISLGIFLFFLILKTQKSSFKKFFHLFLFLVWIFILLSIFKTRMPDDGLLTIDRIKFLLIFINEISRWGFVDFLIGKHPLTPLSYESCKALSFYKHLFSYTDPDICFSVILHMFILRIIYDHGFIGLIFIFWGIYKILSLSYIEKKFSIFVIFLLIINGLSVSSFNNIFTLLGLLILTNLSYFLYKFYRRNRHEFH